MVKEISRFSVRFVSLVLLYLILGSVSLSSIYPNTMSQTSIPNKVSKKLQQSLTFPNQPVPDSPVKNLDQSLSLPNQSVQDIVEFLPNQPIDESLSMDLHPNQPVEVLQESLPNQPVEVLQESLPNQPVEVLQESLPNQPVEVLQESLPNQPEKVLQESLPHQPVEVSQESLPKFESLQSVEDFKNSPPKIIFAAPNDQSKLGKIFRIQPTRRYRKKRVMFGVELDDPIIKTYGKCIIFTTFYCMLLTLGLMITAAIASSTFTITEHIWLNFNIPEYPEQDVIRIIIEIGIDKWDPFHTTGRKICNLLIAVAIVPIIISIAFFAFSIYVVKRVIKTKNTFLLNALLVFIGLTLITYFLLIVACYAYYNQAKNETDYVSQMAADLVDKVGELTPGDPSAMQRAVSTFYFGRYRREILSALVYITSAAGNCGNIILVLFFTYSALIWPTMKLILIYNPIDYRKHNSEELIADVV